MKIVLLVSGRLGFEILKDIASTYKVVAVFTDKASQEIIGHCKKLDVRYFVGNPRGGNVLHLTRELNVDVLLSVNYLFLIEKDLIEWPRLYAINFHGSLLPKYRGRTPHVWAIINNETITGITAHLIDEGCDTGPIVGQLIVPIEAEDSGATILDRYIVLYPQFVRQIIKKVEGGTLSPKPQANEEATYYSKRTPEDGRINWSWQKERIQNWVRALAFPYPGAFTFYDQKKIIINWVEFSNAGYYDSIPDGTILKVETGLPVVKTQNGALLIKEYKSPQKITFEQGAKFL